MLTIHLMKQWNYPLTACILLLLMIGCNNSETANSSTLDANLNEIERCPSGEAIETDGHRRLALIVGVGQYKKEGIPDLKGPPRDAEQFYSLLTGKDGYGFPRENVCLLLNEEASTDRFKKAFDQLLVNRARSQDVAVVFFAGHGSLKRDREDEEPDGFDETLMFHDARTAGVGDLVDDEFNRMLARLHARTKHITVWLDSCNSGTATRGDANTYIARFFKPAEEEISQPTVDAELIGEDGAGWVPEAMPGLVVLTAASDGTPALEINGRGIFTDAIIQVLSQASDKPLTYAQIARQIPPLVAARSYQIPYFHGDLNTPVFGNSGRTRPIAWEISKLGPPIQLSGPTLPGIGVGAELRVYDGGMTGSETRDPAKAKATLIIDNMTGLNATAHISAARPDSPKLDAGDLAVLARPADESLLISVRLRPANESGGIPEERASKLRAAIEANPETKLLVRLNDKAGEFELSVNANQRLILKGPENRIRNVYQDDRDVADNLWQHARQSALLQLQGEGGSDFTDNQTLQVQLVPAARQPLCADGVWEQAEPNSEQVIPLCHAWYVKVKLSKTSPTSLLVGGVILSTNGNTFGFPADGRKVALKPGEEVTFNSRQETFQGTPPLDIQDRIMVFGTQETNPVQWHLLTETSATRSAGPPMSGLYRALHRYLKPGTRGTGRLEDAVEDTTWTLSSLTARVEANQRFIKAKAGTTESPSKREYTIANFDIRPYLPDDRDTALYRILRKADELAHASAIDGYGYKQHDWSLPTDQQNLQRGIDCSRSIWYAFTRAGLPYNSRDRYLTTAMMVGRDSAMAEQFENCSNSIPQLGDILVYRDDTRGDGHVVMVIDPRKRIAWGSHGWDGNAKALKIAPDTGVEYQLIKYKQDWLRWDRRTMDLKACWRYRRFIEEARTQRGLPGVEALTDVCDSRKRCGS